MKYLLLLTLLLFPCIANASECDIEAKAVIGFLDFDIEGCKIQGKLKRDGNTVSGEFSADLKSLDTGLDLRNEHMRDKYLEVKKFPTAKFTLDPTTKGSKHFTGKFTLHGVTKEVKGDVLKFTDDKFKAKLPLKITDFGIEKPGYEDIVIGENIVVTVTL